VTFRTRTFLVVLVASAAALVVALWLLQGTLRQTMATDIEQGLARQAALAGELLAGQTNLADPEAEALHLGRLLDERVTLIAADGRVLGDSEVAETNLPAVENHATRPEVVSARTAGAGTAVRRSATTGIETVYAAVAVRDSVVSVVRVARPIAILDERMAFAIHHPARTPRRISESHPAHLHINLLPHIQGRGSGAELVKAWLSAMHRRGVPRAHLAVGAKNANAVGFYRRFGFTELERSGPPFDVIWFGIDTAVHSDL